ncbi:MAG TPA: CBS domain-containing protein [Longimicrobiaceae bacterium]|nr:CBS domain-containing protein [Longimicrobiaceae bacterium]
MDGYGRDYRGPVRRDGRGYDVWYVPDSAPQAGMFPGGEGRFTFRRGQGWYDEEYLGHTGAEGMVFERGPGGGRSRARAEPPVRRGRYASGWTSAYGSAPGGELSDADRIRAAEIMTANPEAVTPDTSLGEAARLMRDLDVGILPVVDGDENARLLGVITDRDLVVRALAEGRDGGARVGDFMTTEVETVGPGDTVHDVMNVMKRQRVRRVPVTDSEGCLVGIIAQADLAVSYAGLDLQRETEVEEVIERISEPGPRRHWR